VTSLEIRNDELIVHVRGWDRVFAFKSELRIPLAHVEGVARAGTELDAWKGWRVPGTSFPGFHAGTFYGRDGRAFWDVRGRDNAIAVYLRDDRFSKLIIDVDDPEAAIAMITRAAATPR
jgi:hypothetical protein